MHFKQLSDFLSNIIMQNKQMKRKGPLAFIIAFLITLMTFSCHKHCPTGYAGSQCTAVNLRYLGTYAGGNIVTADGSANPPVPDTITISAGTGPDSILINNIGSPIRCVVASDGNSFSVASQTVAYRGVSIDIISGKGALTGDTLKAVFNCSSGGLPVTIAFTGVRE